MFEVNIQLNDVKPHSNSSKLRLFVIGVQRHNVQLPSAERLNGSILALHCRDAIRRLSDTKETQSHQRQGRGESHGRRGETMAKRWANGTS